MVLVQSEKFREDVYFHIVKNIQRKISTNKEARTKEVPQTTNETCKYLIRASSKKVLGQVVPSCVFCDGFFPIDYTREWRRN